MNYLNNTKNPKSRNNIGFTIIELVVVMAVFLFIIGAAIGIFISIIQNQKKILSEQQLLNQISYAEEYMSKALRMATIDPKVKTDPSAPDGCLGPNNAGYIYLLTDNDIAGSYAGFFRGIRFYNQSDYACHEFFLDNTDGILKEEKDNDPATITPITSSDLQINSIRFSINGSDGSANGCSDPNQCGALLNTASAPESQPRITILMNVSIPGDKQGANIICSSTADCPSGQACYSSTHVCVPTRTIQTTVSQRNLNIQ